MKLYTFREHLAELKKRLLLAVAFFVFAVSLSYYFSSEIFQVMVGPLQQIASEPRKIIYTGLTEAFVTYVRLACYTGFFLSTPFIAIQIYLFIAPGLYKVEKIIVGLALISSPILFFAGAFFVFHYVMPKAWLFFLSFENFTDQTSLVLEARISEYFSLVLQLILAFGFAFQLPVIMVILNILGLIRADNLRRKRRLAIVINFILAAIFTPPDVLSQLTLALPLILLYEFSILLCRILENRGLSNDRYKVD